VKTIPAAKFKEQCLALLDRVGPEDPDYQKRQAVAKLVPVDTAVLQTNADSAVLSNFLKMERRVYRV